MRATTSSANACSCRLLAEALGFARKGSGFDIRDVRRRSIADRLGDVRVLAHELRPETLEEPKQVRRHNYLSITLRPSADADCRDAQFGSDSLSNVGRYAFQDDREGAGLGHGA